MGLSRIKTMRTTMTNEAYEAKATYLFLAIADIIVIHTRLSTRTLQQLVWVLEGALAATKRTLGERNDA